MTIVAVEYGFHRPALSATARTPRTRTNVRFRHCWGGSLTFVKATVQIEARKAHADFMRVCTMKMDENAGGDGC